MKLSKNLSLLECTKSITAKRLDIDNTPSEEAIDNLKCIAGCVFQPLRDHFDVPIGINSGYRSEALNKAVGGSKTSQHMLGEALDIDADIYGRISNKEIFDYIRGNLDYDQLIWEFGGPSSPDWVHVSFRRENNRREALRATRMRGKVYYTLI